MKEYLARKLFVGATVVDVREGMPIQQSLELSSDRNSSEVVFKP